jgi:alanine racemase
MITALPDVSAVAKTCLPLRLSYTLEWCAHGDRSESLFRFMEALIPSHLEVTAQSSGLRPTRLEINLARLRKNYQTIARHVAPARVMPVLKANAYGHGLVAVTKMLEREQPFAVAVAYLEEATRLREAGVRLPVLVLGGIVGAQIPRFIEQDVTLTASSADKLLAIEACAVAMRARARVHLKVDTGMERIGTHWYSAERLLETSLHVQNVDVEGIFTHFANADAADLTHARLQLERFQEVLYFYERHSLPAPLRHAANSGAILQLPESYLDIVRPGILLFGSSPDIGLPLTLAVQQALRWLTQVVFFKVVKAGNPVSYGSTWQPAADTRVITLPVGYGDGYMRAMSGRAQVIVRGRRVAVAGRICMDQIMVDIGNGTAYNGDEVVLLGESGRDAEVSIRIEEMATWANTIPHEILTNINTRVPRVYVDEVDRTG